MKKALTLLTLIASACPLIAGHAYKAVADWVKLPEGRAQLGNMHGDAAVSSAGEVYVSVQSPKSVWRTGIVTAPHGVAFNAGGDLFVAEYSTTGRVHRMNKAKKKPSPEKLVFKPILNGKDLAGWKVPNGNDKAGWYKMVDGVLEIRSGPKRKGSVLWTEKKFRNFVAEFDFRFGEGTVDSGVHLRTQDQIQIGISGSLKRDMTCSPYIPGKGYPVEARNIKKLLKAKDWNTMRIQAIGNEYKVWLQGEEVMTYKSGSAKEEGPIGIQLHGNRNMGIDYRNIRLAELP